MAATPRNNTGQPSRRAHPDIVPGARAVFSAFCLLLCLALTACTGNQPTPQQRHDTALALLNQTMKDFHQPSAEATGAARVQLLNQAAASYADLLKKCSDQPDLCAQALRNLGSIRAAQGRLDEAVGRYSDVAKKYPQQDWEVLQSWKSAADLLADAKRTVEAKVFYGKIVERFDRTNAPPVVKTIVRGSKSRLLE
jgi:tetratricopeptide (TPR) repeat protein